MQDFVQLCEPSQRQSIVEYILLTPENFVNCEQNCLPMKIFRDIFLQGGISFDISSLFNSSRYSEINLDDLKLETLRKHFSNQDNFAWFASILLNINNMGSLNNLPDLKRQLSVFLEIEVVPALIVTVQNGQKDLVMQLIESFKTKVTDSNDSCLSTLENLVSKMVNPGDDFQKSGEALLQVDDFKQIFRILSQEKAKTFLDKDYASISPTDIKLMSSIFKQTAYYILDEPEVSSLIKLAKKNLHIDILTKQGNMQEVAYSLQLYLSLFTHFQTDYDSEMQEFVLQWIIGNFSENFFVKAAENPK
jgi:hypothetical protein